MRGSKMVQNWMQISAIEFSSRNDWRNRMMALYLNISCGLTSTSNSISNFSAVSNNDMNIESSFLFLFKKLIRLKHS